MRDGTPDRAHGGMQRSSVRFGALVAMLVTLVLPVAEAHGQRIRVPRLPVPHVVEIPPTTGDRDRGHHERALRRRRPRAVVALDDAGRGVGDNVDSFAAQYDIAAEAPTLRLCTGNGLKGAGEGYAGALEEAAAAGDPVPAPDLDVAVDGAAECLTTYYPDTPDAAIDVGKRLISLAAERAQEAQATAPTGAVLAQWMQVTGDELGQAGGTGNETGSDPPSTGGPEEPTQEEGFPAWLAVLIVVALLVGGGLLVNAKSGNKNAG